MASKFAHLHVHTDYSTLDGACRCDRLVDRVKGLGMDAVAISDHGSLSGIPSFYKAVTAAGLKPIIGCELYLAGKSRTEKVGSDNPTYHMGVVARNAAGYQNLMRISTDAQRSGFHYKPRTDLDFIARHKEGLIAFSGCMQGMIPQMLIQGNMDGARAATQRFIDIFGRDQFFIELMNHGIPEQEAIIKPLLALAKEFNLKTIATNDVHYLMEGDAPAHDAMLCIQTGAKVADRERMRYDPRQFWLKSEEEMGVLFREMPEALANTLAVADMCDFKMEFGGKHYPTVPPPPGFPTTAVYLEYACARGLAERYGIDYYQQTGQPRPESGEPLRLTRTPHRDGRVIAERLKHELSVISRTGFTDYFLVVSDFVDWAKKENIPVGPGRGSGAGCMVAYTLGITAIDPHEYGLLFERFLNPDRVSPPDLDIDFCMHRRGEVIEYVRQKYGADCVSGIITFNTLGAKGALRDLARVHDIPIAEAGKIAKLIPDGAGVELAPTLEQNVEFAELINSKPEYRTIYDQGLVIEGMVRNPGKHASGVLISSKPLENVVPMVRYGNDGEMVAGYDGNVVADLGLLKMDFLGLKTLSVLAEAQKHVRARGGDHEKFDINQVPLDDKATLDLIRSGRTVGVFQFESPGMQQLCRQIGITRFEEIAAANALFRPGPMDLIPDYLRGKREPSSVHYMHPLLEETCKETYGIMVYQEQVMQAAQRVAGYTLAQADLLRRCMGKKKLDEMAKQRATFVAGAKQTNNIEENVANGIFDVLEKFAGYGFNKSHSVGYALLAYQTAYLKSHYPAEFMAAMLTCETGKTEECTKYCVEARAMGLEILPPDINRSGVGFSPEGQGVRYALGGIKTVGTVAAQAIVAEREKNGEFRSMDDLLARVDSKHVNKRVLEAMIKTGCLDSLDANPGRLLARVESSLKNAGKPGNQAGQGSLFDMDDIQDSLEPEEPDVVFTREDRLDAEAQYLGVFVSGHPLDDVKPVVDAICSVPPGGVDELEDRKDFRVCGVVTEMVVKPAKKDGRPWAKFKLNSPSGSYPVQCYADTFARNRETLESKTPIVITGQALRGEEDVRLAASNVMPLTDAIPEALSNLALRVEGDDASDFIERAKRLAAKAPGSTDLVIHGPDGKLAPLPVRVTLPALRAILGHAAVVPGEVEAAARPFQGGRRRRGDAPENVHEPLTQARNRELAQRQAAGLTSMSMTA